MKISRFKQRLLARAVLSTFAVFGTAGAYADQTVDLGSVSVSGTGDGSTSPSVTGKGSATYESPSSVSTNATEPVFKINQHYVEQNASAGSNCVFHAIRPLSPA